MTDKLQDLLTAYVQADNRMVRAGWELRTNDIERAKRDQAEIKQQIAAHFANMVDTAAEGHENATGALQRGSQAHRLASYAGSVLRGVAEAMRSMV